MRYIVIAFAALAGCSSGDLSDVSGVQDVELVGDTLNVNALINMFSEDRFVTQAGTIVHTAAGRIRDDDQYQSARQVRFAFSATTQDDLGNRGARPVFWAEFPMDQLEAANLDNLQGAQMMNLASDFAADDLAGGALLTKHCETRADRSRRFCDRLVSGD